MSRRTVREQACLALEIRGHVVVIVEVVSRQVREYGRVEPRAVHPLLVQRMRRHLNSGHRRSVFDEAGEKAWQALAEKTWSEMRGGIAISTVLVGALLAASTGVGCAKSGAPTRYDLPRHDQTGGGYYMPDVVLYQRDSDTLRFGDVAADQELAMQAGKSRAAAWLTAG